MHDMGIDRPWEGILVTNEVLTIHVGQHLRASVSLLIKLKVCFMWILSLLDILTRKEGFCWQKRQSRMGRAGTEEDKEQFPLEYFRVSKLLFGFACQIPKFAFEQRIYISFYIYILLLDEYIYIRSKIYLRIFLAPSFFKVIFSFRNLFSIINCQIIEGSQKLLT